MVWKASLCLAAIGAIMGACTDSDLTPGESLLPYMQVGGAWEQEHTPSASIAPSPFGKP
jgi:hypothetical protein